MKELEILAPAGNEQCAYTAIDSGANAIYLGLTSFSARSSAENFNADSLERLCAYAHALGVKIYVALNTVVKDAEVEDFFKNALLAYNSGADALIIQDIFLGSLLKKHYPEIVLHLSTQAGVCNVYGAKLAKKMGFDRVIVARETPIEDIAQISKIIECEAFIQGALCTCFSGQCYFSSFVGGNSGNRGRCKQPCRKKYSWNRNGYEELAYRLSLSDLCVGEDIQKLIDAGVTSFKIEGRLRRPEYVGAAVSYYKKLLEASAQNSDFSNLKRAFNRGNYTKGLAFGQDKNFISSAVQGHIGEFVGVLSVENGKYVCKSNVDCERQDGFKILRSGIEVGGGVYGEKIRGGFTINTKARLKNGDKVFITTDNDLINRLNIQPKKHKCHVTAIFTVGKKPVIKIDGYEYIGEEILDSATSRPLSDEDVKRCFLKVDTYPFEVEINSKIEGDIFLPTSKLNALRRNAYEGYYASTNAKKTLKYRQIIVPKFTGENKKTAVICSDLRAVTADIGIFKPDNYSAVASELYKDFNGEKYLYIPAFLTTEDTELIMGVADNFDGLYCEGIWGIELCEMLNKKLFAGVGFNLTNSYSINELNATYYALSKELDLSESKPLVSSKSFTLSVGDIKIMDLIYCPFERTCAKCDMRREYALTDENGRVFPVRRYVTSRCAFEVYNCASLIIPPVGGILADCTLFGAQKVSKNLQDADELKKIYAKTTKGHAYNGIT